MTDLKEALEAVQDQFKEASVDPASNFELPPDGDYQGIIDRFDFFQSKKNDRWYMKTEIKLTTGGQEWEGQVISTLHDVSDPERVGFLKQHLDRMGLDVDTIDLTNLETELEPALDVPVEMAVKTSSNLKDDGTPFRNLYVNGKLGPPMKQGSDVPPDTDGMEETKGSDEDIPF